jgi:hypothetical protein
MRGAGVHCLFCGRVWGDCWVMNSRFIMCKIHLEVTLGALLEIV